MRTSVCLDGLWEYWPDLKNEFPNLNGTDFVGNISSFLQEKTWKTCYVPSVWNLYEKTLMRFFGAVFYHTTFRTPAHENDSILTIHFGGVNYRTLIWINGHFVGEHNTGYTSFSFEINSFIKLDEDNSLLIYVDNSWGHSDRLPWVKTVDWFNYGGIHRSVFLKIKPLVHISDFYLTNTIEFLEAQIECPKSIQLSASLEIKTQGDALKQTVIEWVVLDPKTHEILLNDSQSIIPFTQQEGNPLALKLTASLNPDKVQLWSPDSPKLYLIQFRIRDDEGIELDGFDWKWGFKKLEIQGTKFILNSKQIFLRGTNRHEDHPSFGLALPDALRYQDLLIMKRANINCFRGAHHPNAESVLQFCDELGILFVEEIPNYSLDASMMRNPKLMETAQRYFLEMFTRDKNYTCVIAWSLSNECATETEASRPYHEALYKYARGLDQGNHFVIHVSNRRLMEKCFDLSDFITLNIYDGWYSAKKEDFLHEVHALYDIMMDEEVPFGSVKPIVLTEFGAEGLRGYRTWDAAKWSEDHQAEFLTFYLSECQKMDYVGGTWTWLFSDFRVDLPNRPDGRARSYNNKGMIDEFRLPKVAFTVVQDQYARWKDKTSKINKRE